MKSPKGVIYITTIFLLAGCTLVMQKENPMKTPSLLDRPDLGLYYGFIINNSSHFIETKIRSVQQERKIYAEIVLPPSKEKLKTVNRLNWSKIPSYKNHDPNIFPLWLKLERYEIFIRYRDDIVGGGQPGAWKNFVVVLDNKYVESSPGPFTFEIEDDDPH